MSKHAGFTLVEIMIAIGLIAIIAAFIIPNLNRGSAQSRDAERQAALRTVQGALELYKNKYGRYPEACNPNVIVYNDPDYWDGEWSGEIGSQYECSDGSAEYIIGLAPEFIPRLPRDPFTDGLNDDANPNNDRSYVYATNPDGTVYKFMSINGAEDDLVPTDYEHPFARCGNLFLGEGPLGNECAAIPNSAAGGGYGPGQSYNDGLDPSPLVCRNGHALFPTTYAVWGGYAPGGQRFAAYLDSEKAREWYSDVIRCK